jgi:hypothetical protein
LKKYNQHLEQTELDVKMLCWDDCGYTQKGSAFNKSLSANHVRIVCLSPPDSDICISQVVEAQKLDLRALAYCSETVAAIRQFKWQPLTQTIKHSDTYDVTIFVDPEHLKEEWHDTAGFETLKNSLRFAGMDVVHLIIDWGETSERRLRPKDNSFEASIWQHFHL